jgi:hypothetical protein
MSKSEENEESKELFQAKFQSSSCSDGEKTILPLVAQFLRLIQKPGF